MADESDDVSYLSGSLAAAGDRTDAMNRSMAELQRNANAFARAMSTAFSQSMSGGRQFDDVLKGLALRLSGLSLQAALKPLASALTGGLSGALGGIFGGAGVAAANGAIKPFADGGVIATPTYFPLATGGAGLIGEAGPEAVVPLARGADGRLGIAAGGAAAAPVTVTITTPDADSFRGSEVYLSGQIARAVARGQRGL